MSFRDQSRSYERDLSFSQRTPHDDSIKRGICDHCGLINYVNPKVIAGVVGVWQDKILMCRRAIEPRNNFWTLPAGFMKQGETVAQGAVREAREEACAEIIPDALIGIYNVARISQVHIYYRGALASPDIAVGAEGREVALFDWDDIPWDALAFPSVYWALTHYQQVRGQTAFAPFTEPDDWSKTPGFADIARRYSDDI